MRDDWVLNSVQTAGIISIAAVLVYVVWRLERVMIVVIAALASIERTHKELIDSQHAMEDSLTDVWRRIGEIESRQKAANK